MRKLILIVAALTLVVTGAMAKTPAKSASPSNYSVDFGRSLFEGFEGAFPPAGWTAGITNPTYTWYQDAVSFYEGAYAARIGWQAGSPQDETLSFGYTVAAGDALSFFTMGSTYWCTNGNFTAEVNGTVVYDFCAENGGTSWLWEEVIVDLAAYVGQTVTITFRYAGDDGADHHLDAVNVGEYAPPPPPPPVSFCADAVALYDLAGALSGDTCDGANLVESLGCETYSEAGLEDYYSFELCPGGTFNAAVTNTADGALWLLGDCEAEGGAFTCLAYADGTLSGEEEALSFTNTGVDPMMVYLVVDSWGTASCGTYTGTYTVDNCEVANEDMSFGAVKSLYR